MNIHTFWKLLIRSMGIWLFISGINMFIELIEFLLTGVFYSFSVISQIILPIFGYAMYLGIVFLLLFKTDWVIRVFHLEKGLENTDIQINNSERSILTMSVIVLGGILFILSIPEFIDLIIQSLQSHRTPHSGVLMRKIIYEVVKLAAAYLMITNSRKIVDFIIRKAAKDSKKSKLDILD